jgi:hypothetical protein
VLWKAVPAQDANVFVHRNKNGHFMSIRSAQHLISFIFVPKIVILNSVRCAQNTNDP